jgi:hypothetical protein
MLASRATRTDEGSQATLLICPLAAVLADVDPRLISCASADLLACAQRHQIIQTRRNGAKTVTYHPLRRLMPLYLDPGTDQFQILLVTWGRSEQKESRAC